MLEGLYHIAVFHEERRGSVVRIESRATKNEAHVAGVCPYFCFVRLQQPTRVMSGVVSGRDDINSARGNTQYGTAERTCFSFDMDIVGWILKLIIEPSRYVT